MTGPPDLHQTRMESAAEPPFHEELEAVWGAAVGRVRRGRPAAQGARPPAGRRAVRRARRRVGRGGAGAGRPRRTLVLDRPHAARPARACARSTRVWSRALEAEGVEVVVAEPLGGGFVKAIYTRDPLVTIPGGAVIGRMAVRARRGEEAAITREVAAAGLPILSTITGTATLEGGSFVKLRPGLAAFGTSIRCNAEGARQLREVLARIGWELIVVPLPGYTIHLDLHLAMVDVDRALVNAPGLPFDFLERLRAEGIETLHAAPGEEWGLNALCLKPGRVLMAEGSPRSADMLDRAGVDVVTVPYDEIHKNGGGVHCSTMELLAEPAA